MESLSQDMRYAWRSLVGNPGYALVAILTLALGIGANTAIFSVLYGVLLRPLPYPAPEQLVGLDQVFQGARGAMAVTASQARFLQERATPFAHLGASTPVDFNVLTGGEAEHLDGLRVSSQYFAALGTPPALGRDFTADDDRVGGAPVAIISHDFWQRRFGTDPAVLGRTLWLDGVPTTIIGVMPAGFASLPAAEVWSPLEPVAASIGSGQNLSLIGRLKSGITVDQADAMLAPTVADFKSEFARIFSPEAGVRLVAARDQTASAIATPIRVLIGAIAIVLLIACANVASLLLGRAAARGREFAVRAAIGAPRRRIVRQVLTESLILAGLGAGAGLLLAHWMLAGLLGLAPEGLVSGARIALDRSALLFTLAIASLTGLLVGLLPALHASRSDLNAILREGGSRGSTAGSAGRWRTGLVVAEISLSLVLLVGAGLLIRTVANLMREDPGFDPRGVVSAELWLRGTRYQSPEATAAYYSAVIERIRATPGVISAAVVEAGQPLVRGGNLPARLAGAPEAIHTDYRTVTPDYFATLGVAITAGRGIAAGDVAGAPVALVVNEAFVRQHLAGTPPLGRLVTLGGSGGTEGYIVGVAGDVRSFVGLPAQPTVFLASAQTPAGFTRIFNSWFPIHLLVRTTGPTAPIESAVARVLREVDAQVPVGAIRSLEHVLRDSLAFERFIMLMLTVFGGVAAALAVVGVYGVMTSLVILRTREIGVRLALGASRTEVLGMIMRRGLALTGAGVVLGLAGALAFARVLASQLYEVPPGDPFTLAGVSCALAAVALFACYLPARRAMHVDPIVALRAD